MSVHSTSISLNVPVEDITFPSSRFIFWLDGSIGNDLLHRYIPVLQLQFEEKHLLLQSEIAFLKYIKIPLLREFYHIQRRTYNPVEYK